MTRGKKPIDLGKVRKTLRELDEIVEKHPELRGQSSERNRAEWEAVLAENEENMATVQVAFRLEKELIDRVDAYAKKMADENPGISSSPPAGASPPMAVVSDPFGS